MDIVEFVEKVCEFSLTDFQKEFVRIAYDAAKNDKRLHYVLPRCNQKFNFELLQAISRDSRYENTRFDNGIPRH